MDAKSDIFSCDCLTEIFHTSKNELLQLTVKQAQDYIKRVYREISISIHPDKNKDHPDLATKTSQDVTNAKNIILEWILFNNYQQHDEDIVSQEHICDEIETTIRSIAWLKMKKHNGKRNHDEMQDDTQTDDDTKKIRTDDEKENIPVISIESDEEDCSSTHSNDTESSEQPDGTENRKQENHKYKITNHTTRRGKPKFQIEIDELEIKDWIPAGEADPNKIKDYLRTLKCNSPKRFVNLIKRKDIGPELQRIYSQYK